MLLRTLCLATAMCTLLCGCANLGQAKTDFTQQVPWDGFDRISVQTHNGWVDVREGSDRAVKILGNKQICGATQAEAEADLARVEVFVGAAPGEPGTLLVALRYPPEFEGRHVGASFLIELPQPCPAHITTSNGHITVRGLAGDVHLGTSNGAIAATNIDGPLTAETSNGGIVLHGATTGIEARTSNGSIVAREIRGGIVLRTSNGHIDVAAATATTGAMDLRTSNGGIRAALPSSLAADLDLSTSNGHVEVSVRGAALDTTAATRAAFRGALNGGGATLKMHASNGSIVVTGR